MITSRRGRGRRGLARGRCAGGGEVAGRGALDHAAVLLGGRVGGAGSQRPEARCLARGAGGVDAEPVHGGPVQRRGRGGHRR